MLWKGAAENNTVDFYSVFPSAAAPLTGRLTHLWMTGEWPGAASAFSTPSMPQLREGCIRKPALGTARAEF
jgi:hypothetical protein